MRLLKNKTYRILLLIIAFTTIISIITGTRKYAFHVDELWSYGLSNSYDRPQLCNYSTYQELKDDGYNVWFSANDFKEYLTVQKGETFSYDKVVYNQKNDSHPPLFYAILHTISSLNTDSFSIGYLS